MNNRKEDMEISSHYRQLLRELNEQRQHGILCDACVVVDGKIFKAHKNVLLGSSRYFKTLYCQVKKGAEPHHQTTVTHLDIVTATGFKAILDFIYSAHLALTSKNVIEVMSAASYLQMTDIVQACHRFIKAALDITIRSDMADELPDFEMGAIAAANLGGEEGRNEGGLTSSKTGNVIRAGLNGGAGFAGTASEALASIMSGRSTSPWHTSPANSSGDSAIASCHEGGSMYGKEDQEPFKSHESQEETGQDSQPAWPHDNRQVTVKEEQVSPNSSSSNSHESHTGAVKSQGKAEMAGTSVGGGEGPWQPLSGSGRRKNRKNKDTVRHITRQAERNWDREQDREKERHLRPGSPLPSMLTMTGWNCTGQDFSGIEPRIPDGRDDRLDFFLKQEEAVILEPGFMGTNESEEHAGGVDDETVSSVANLKAALMSKNSLLSLRAEMLGDDNHLLYEYLPKGGHTLTWLHSDNYCSTLQPKATGGTMYNKQETCFFPSSPCRHHHHPHHHHLSSPPPSPSPAKAHSNITPPTLVLPTELQPQQIPSTQAGESTPVLHLQALHVGVASVDLETSSLPKGEDDGGDTGKITTVLAGDPMPVEKNPTANRNSVGGLTASAFVAGRENDGLKSSAKRASLEKKDVLPEPGGPWSSQEFTCSLCQQMFSSRERLRDHEYHHTVPQMSHDWPGVKGLHYQAPLPELQFHQSLYRSTVAMSVPGRYSCSHCPARFTLKSNASRHEKTIHLKKKLLKCIHCLKHFRDRTDLHRHVSSMHSKVRHTCPACAKDFSTTQNLATHFEMCCPVLSMPGIILGGSKRMASIQGQGYVSTLAAFTRN